MTTTVTDDDEYGGLFMPPSDIDAERYVLSAMMWSREAISAVCELLEPGHFHRPGHQELYRAMVTMDAADMAPDPVTVRAWLDEDGAMRALGGQAAGTVYLADLYGLHALGANAAHYAKLVLAAALRRKGIEEAQRAISVLGQPGTDPDEILGRFDITLERIRTVAAPRRRAATGFAAVTADVEKERNPVIPGLLDEQDRAVVVATEGRGKTTLAHQLGFAAAAGVHPFRPQTRYEPRRVLIADFENPALELGRRFARLGEVAAWYTGWDESNIQFYLRMGGINLTQASDAFEFMDVIRRHEPHLVIAGPIYKMLAGLRPDQDGLRAHAAVAAFFDKVRERHGSAVWLEAHAPFGPAGRDRELRPEGWNGWAKWPEFGFALHKATKAHGGDTAVDIKRFRGDRIAGRPWPDWLTRNQTGGWPWVANYGQGVLDRDEP